MESDAKISGEFLRDANVQVFTASGTYTPTAGVRYIVVEVQAGGGNGVAGGSNSNGGSGGSGGYSRKLILDSALGATETVTIGATTSFGSHNTTTEGGDASGGTAGTAGTASGGDLNAAGIAGEAGESNDGSGSSSEYRNPQGTPSFMGCGPGYGGRGGFKAGGGEAGKVGIIIVTEYL